MSVDYTGTDGAQPAPESESSMFAPTPVWDRSRKGRSGRRTAVRNERVAMNDAAAAAATGGLAGGALGTVPPTADETAVGGDAPFVAPRARTTTVRRGNSVAPAVAVGLIALAALAAAGWYATRPDETALTPGGPGAPATSVASTTPANSAATGGADTVAANTPPASAAAAAAPAETRTTRTTTRRTETAMNTRRPVEHHRAVSRTVSASPERSVTSQSATSAGVNTGATVPPTVGSNQTSMGMTSSAPMTAAPPPPAMTTRTNPAAPTSPPITTTPMTPSTPAPATTTPDMTSPSASTATTPGTTSSSTATPPQ